MIRDYPDAKKYREQIKRRENKIAEFYDSMKEVLETIDIDIDKMIEDKRLQPTLSLNYQGTQRTVQCKDQLDDKQVSPSLNCAVLCFSSGKDTTKLSL